MDNDNTDASVVASQEEIKAANQARLQRKIIAAFEYNNAALLNADDAPEDIGKKEQFYIDINEGRIGDEQFKAMITNIRGPEGRIGADGIFRLLAGSNHKRRILAYASGVGFNNFENTSDMTVASFLEQYPNPADFEMIAHDLLEIIQRSNSEEKYKEYVAAMDDFKHNVYGLKQEYWDQTKALNQQAFMFSAHELPEFLNNPRIDGDPWQQGGRLYNLSLDALKQVNLVPRHKVEFGGVEFGLTGSFMVGARCAVLAYVKTENGTNIRAYIRSNSAGLWRYLPDYIMSGDGIADKYGKGYSEESLMLPTELQVELNKIAKWDQIDLSQHNTEFFICGTAKRYNSMEEYNQARDNGTLRGDFYQEVKHEPTVDYGELGTQKHPPESLSIDGGQAPNFRKSLIEYGAETSVVGAMKVKQYASYDDSLRYSVCETRESGDRRVWIGGVEVNASVSSTGCRVEWVSAGDLATPLFELEEMAGGFGESSVRRNNDYVSMWENYLSRAPIIKQYLYNTDKSVAQMNV